MYTFTTLIVKFIFKYLTIVKYLTGIGGGFDNGVVKWKDFCVNLKTKYNLNRADLHSVFWVTEKSIAVLKHINSIRFYYCFK